MIIAGVGNKHTHSASSARRQTHARACALVHCAYMYVDNGKGTKKTKSDFLGGVKSRREPSALLLNEGEQIGKMLLQFDASLTKHKKGGIKGCYLYIYKYIYLYVYIYIYKN